MSGYIPADSHERYDPSTPQLDSNGVPIRLYSQPETLYTEYGASASTAYHGTFYGDKSMLSNNGEGTYTSTIVAASPDQPNDSQWARGRRPASVHFRPEGQQLRHEFRRKDQARALAKSIAFRLAMTAVFAGALVAMISYYDQKGIIPLEDQMFFNGWNLALSLMLSMSLVAGLKSMADMFRWRVLASSSYGGHSAKELDLILGISSYATSVKLLWRWRRKWKYSSFLLSWVIIGIGVQVALGLLALCYTYDPSETIRTTTGPVKITNFTVVPCPEMEGRVCNPDSLEQGSRAHILGVRSEGLEWWQDNFAHPNNTIGTFDDFRIDIVYNWFNNEWMYPFKDYALPKDVKTAKFPLIHRTERHVNITTKCDMYPIVSGQNGGPRNVKVLVNGTEQEHPWADEFKAANKTVYMNPNINPSTEERSGYDWDSTKYNCGPRCGYTFIYRFVHNTSIPTGDFINCTTKVSTVHNAKAGVAEHQVPDKVASRIASSIGSSSFMKYNQQHKMLYSFNVMDSNTNYDTWDFLEGVPGSWNETNPPYSSARRGSFLLSRFAIGSLAMLDSTGPRLMAEGDAPYLGIKMDVNWQKVADGVAGLLGVQLLAGIVTLWLSYPVVCKDSSYWSTARLLRPVVQRMEETGSMASGDQIAGLFKNRNMRYGVRTDKEGNNYLEILLDTPDFIPGSDTRYKKGAHFPKGYYE